MDLQNLLLDVDQHIDINAPVADVFEGLINRLGAGNTTPGDEPMPMCLERWPGGRWFRDTGDKTGHLWGFVQVIKPPSVLEIYGPMFMSYPVAAHLSVRLTEAPGGGTRVALRHQALGLIQQDHREGVTQGWQHYLNKIKSDCE